MEAGIAMIITAILISAIALFAGVLLGSRERNKRESHGVLNVDCSDPANGTYLYLELSVPIAEVVDHKQVSFNVHVIR